MTAALGAIGWALIAGSAAIFAGVMVLLAFALRARGQGVDARRWIVAGGVLFPAAVLAALFAWMLAIEPLGKLEPPPGARVVRVTGHMWWWEVRYADAAGNDVFSANEIRIPVGEPVYLALASPDVIHSFWVPGLGGKMDMVPGRMQHLLVRAERAGTWRGQCAEFCGEQHARMAMHVTALAPAEFDAWLRREASPAAPPVTARQRAGREAFLANRCDACHAVRGVGADSRLGPDLTHLASRASIAAGTLPNTQEARERWIAHTQQVKPGARMPSYERLDAATLAAIADWLGSLR